MKIQHLVTISICLVVCSCPGSMKFCHAFQLAENDQATSKDDDNNDEEDSVSIASRSKTRFLRLKTDEFKNPVALQTATTKYLLMDDAGEVQLEVSLESVIHIADASYYRGFQKRFERYDTVLYESLVKLQEPESNGDDLPSGFQMFQQLSTGTLGLAYQFEEVDYKRQNMLRADLSAEEIAGRMAERGETKTTLLMDLLAHLIQKVNVARQNEQATTNQSEPADETESFERRHFPRFNMSLLTDPDGVMKIRRAMATALLDSKLLDSAFPPSIHQLIIGDRNDRAMSTLGSEKKKGKRRIAIFFGVGHMADFEKRLIQEYGMQRAAVNWRNAWDLRDGAIEGAPLEGLIESTFRDSFKNKLRQYARGLQDKPKTENSSGIVESEKDEKIKTMENALKVLEAKVKEMESQSRGNEDDTPDKSGQENKTKGDGEDR